MHNDCTKLHWKVDSVCVCITSFHAVDQICDKKNHIIPPRAKEQKSVYIWIIWILDSSYQDRQSAMGSENIMDELATLIRTDIPEGRQSLQDSYTNLARVAEYCEDTYYR